MLTKRKAQPLYTQKFKKRKPNQVIKTRTFNPPRRLFTWASLTYCDQPYTLNPGAAGTAAVQLIAANGLYDVDISGTGHQPTGFDQYMAMFNEYIVTEAEIECYFVNTDTVYPMQIGLAFLDFSNTTTDSRRYIENGNCISKIVGNAGGATSNIGVLRMKVDMRQFSKTQNIYNEDNFTGQAGTNPVDTHYFHAWAAPVAGVDAEAVLLRVVITFKVLFRDPSLNSLS